VILVLAAVGVAIAYVDRGTLSVALPFTGWSTNLEFDSFARRR
jgi:hypothetical protein